MYDVVSQGSSDVFVSHREKMLFMLHLYSVIYTGVKKDTMAFIIY